MEHILEQFRNMNPMVLYDLEKFYYKSFQTILKIIKGKFLADMISKNIEWGIKDELFRPETNIDVIS